MKHEKSKNDSDDAMSSITSMQNPEIFFGKTPGCR